MSTHRIAALAGWFFAASAFWISPTWSAWTEFRGPTGQGHSRATDLPLVWSPTEHIRWKTAIPGNGWSSPVVTGNQIFVTSAVPIGGSDDLALCLFRLDGQTGEVTNSVEVFREQTASAPQIHSKNSHASPTPVIEGDRIYVHFGHQGTACFDLSGRAIWKNDSIQYDPRHGNGGSPILAGNHLIFSCDGDQDPFVVALNKQTGEVAWRTARQTDAAKTFSFSTPLLIDVAGQWQVISPGSNCCVAYDPVDGHEIWRVRYDGYSVVPRPVYGHGLVYISTSFNSPVAMAIRPDGQGDVTETHVAWTAPRCAQHAVVALGRRSPVHGVRSRGGQLPGRKYGSNVVARTTGWCIFGVASVRRRSRLFSKRRR